MLSFLAGYLVGYLWMKDAKYVVCSKCHTRIRVNKPFLESLHPCKED